MSRLTELLKSNNYLSIFTTCSDADIILFKGLNLLGRWYRFYFIITGLLFTTVCAESNDSIGVADSGSGVVQTPQVKVWNPVVTGAFSAVIPGGGQFYTRHYIKAGSFLALEAITAGMANFWYRTSLYRDEEADVFKESADVYREAATIYKLLEDSINQLGIDSIAAQDYRSWASSQEAQALESEERAALLRYDAKDARYKMYNALSWMVGGYVYNIFDGLGSSRFFFNDKQKSPTKAAWLSAIPGLGLGQLYNGSLSKAGMIMMTQVSMGVMAVNYHRLVNEAQRHYSTAVDTSFNQDWEWRRSTAFRNRNQWIWYSLAFYFYGILDAVVDAHLHDYNRKLRAYPDLVPELSALRINVDYRF